MFIYNIYVFFFFIKCFIEIAEQLDTYLYIIFNLNISYLNDTNQGYGRGGENPGVNEHLKGTGDRSTLRGQFLCLN